MQLAMGSLALNDFDAAVEWLSRRVDGADPHVPLLHLWEFLDPLRAVPPFVNLLRRTGLPKPPIPSVANRL